jgi:hypothetical protein
LVDAGDGNWSQSQAVFQDGATCSSRCKGVLYITVHPLTECRLYNCVNRERFVRRIKSSSVLTRQLGESAAKSKQFLFSPGSLPADLAVKHGKHHPLRTELKRGRSRDAALTMAAAKAFVCARNLAYSPRQIRTLEIGVENDVVSQQQRNIGRAAWRIPPSGRRGSLEISCCALHTYA